MFVRLSSDEDDLLITILGYVSELKQQKIAIVLRQFSLNHFGSSTSSRDTCNKYHQLCNFGSTGARYRKPLECFVNEIEQN